MSKSLSHAGYAASLLSLLLIVPGEIPVQAQDRCIGTGHLSQPVHTAKYLEAFGSQGYVPNWSAGRLARPGGAIPGHRGGLRSRRTASIRGLDSVSRIDKHL